jgi:release factor glutamine methyltransferase
LLEDILNKDRTHLLAHPDIMLTSEQQMVLSGMVQRRSSHQPLAYIRKKTEFYGREFYINQHVLVPRPESETIIDVLKQLHLPKGTHIADIGTGSGVLAITAALEVSDSTVIGTDIDQACLRVASHNAKLHMANVSFLQGNLMTALSGVSAEPMVLLANLPYVPDDFPINKAAAHEPRTALFGGTDGLDVYRALFTQLHSSASRPTFVITESLPSQHDSLAKIAHDADFHLQLTQDFVQLFAEN